MESLRSSSVILSDYRQPDKGQEKQDNHFERQLWPLFGQVHFGKFRGMERSPKRAIVRQMKPPRDEVPGGTGPKRLRVGGIVSMLIFPLNFASSKF